MRMPGRQYGNGPVFAGGDYDSTSLVNGYSLPADLQLSARPDRHPEEYVAAASIELLPGFSSSEGDSYQLYIADETYAGSGNQPPPGSADGKAGYRFGFNGQERSAEMNGLGNSYTAEFWEYDTRLGRRWNVDPVNMGATSSYAAFANNPLIFVDPLGLDTVNSSRKAGIGDVFQHQNNNSNFFWIKTAKGWEGGGSSENLASVVFTFKKKRTNNYIHWPEIHIGQAAWNDEMYARIRDKKPMQKIGDPPWAADQINFHIRNYQAQEDGRMLQGIFAGAIGAPIAITGLAESGAGYYLYQRASSAITNFGLSFAEETLKEFAANRFQVRKMDWADVFVSTATSKLGFWGRAGAEVFNATNDFSIENGWQNSFIPGQYNKLFKNTFIDGAFGILKLGAGNGMNSMFIHANLDQLRYEVYQGVEQPH
jgi:RHS repeat-associated protein